MDFIALCLFTWGYTLYTHTMLKVKYRTKLSNKNNMQEDNANVSHIPKTEGQTFPQNMGFSYINDEYCIHQYPNCIHCLMIMFPKNLH